MTELTVVIPTHGKRPLLQATLTALAAQDLEPESWNVVVVDDASPDDTPMFLEEEAGRWGARLRVVRPDANVGRARARNMGAAAADGAWILFMDDDVVAPAGLLSAHLNAVAGAADRGTIGRVVTAPAVVDAPHFHYIDTRGVAKVAGGEVPARYLVTQNTAVPRRIFEIVGGFDEAFLAYGFEDMDLGYRLENAGVVFHALAEPVPEHVHHHSFEAWLDKKRECGHGPLQRIAENHPERIADLRLELILDAPGRTPSLPVRALRRLAAGVIRPILALLLSRWPADRAHRARAFPMYARLMDVLVLTTYCQGLSDHDRTSQST